MSTRKRSTTETDPAVAFHLEAEASRQRLTDCRRLTQQRAEEQAAAETALAAIRRAWQNGDDSVPAEAEPVAVSAVSRAEALFAYAQGQERKAAAAVLSTDTRLADGVRALVAAVLKVQPTVQPFRPTEPASAPSAVIVQERATEVDTRTGGMSGVVDVIWTREDVHREAEPSAFVNAADDHGVTVSTAYLSDSKRDGTRYVEEVVRLVIASVLPQVPTIAVRDVAGAAHEVARDIAGLVGQRNSYAAADGPRTAFDTGQRLGIVTVAHPPRVVTDETDANGLRTVTFEVQVSGRAAKVPYTLTGARESICEAVQEQAGRAVPALGRITSARVLSSQIVQDSEHGNADTMTVVSRLVAVSRAPEADGQEPQALTASVPVQGAPAEVTTRGRARRDPSEDGGSLSHPGVHSR